MTTRLIEADSLQRAIEESFHNAHPVLLDMKKIEPNPNQPRKHFDKEKLEELAASIAEKKYIHFIIVRRIGNDKYQIVAGERRYKAAKMLGLERMPAVIRDDIIDDDDTLEQSYIENYQKQDLTPEENEHTIYTIYKRTKSKRADHDHSVREVMRKLGIKGKGTVQNYIEAAQAREQLADAIASDVSSTVFFSTQPLREDPRTRAELINMVHDRKGGLRVERTIIKDVANILKQAEDPKIKEAFLKEEIPLEKVKEFADIKKESDGKIPAKRIDSFIDFAKEEQELEKTTKREAKKKEKAILLEGQTYKKQEEEEDEHKGLTDDERFKKTYNYMSNLVAVMKMGRTYQKDIDEIGDRERMWTKILRNVGTTHPHLDKRYEQLDTMGSFERYNTLLHEETGRLQNIIKNIAQEREESKKYV